MVSFSVTNITKLKCLHQAASRTITGCLSSSTIPLFLCEASLHPQPVTLTHFTLSSYERTFYLPTSFFISGLARLGVKPRLFRSSWIASASTHLLMLSSPREALLACPPSPCWNLLFSLWSPRFLLHAPALTPSLVMVQLSLTLTLFHLTIWYLGLRLCSFSFWQRQLWRTCQLLSLWQ